MNLTTLQNVYFIGIGGIGMSALARYFKSLGKQVAGYDKTPTHLTDTLQSEGIAIHFVDDLNCIEAAFKNPDDTLIIYTPAIPSHHSELNYFLENKFEVKKRSQVLGIASNDRKSLAVAGTHGKTSTSTMIAHLFKQSKLGCNAFLGGISKNYNSNFLLSPNSDYVVVEADEFDRSFLQLTPSMAVITSVDADHLDIYGTHESILDSFGKFASQVKENGTLIVKQGLDFQIPTQVHTKGIKVYTYAINQDADFQATNIKGENGFYTFDVNALGRIIKDIHLGVPCLTNVENSVAAIAIALLSGISDAEIKTALNNFRGVQRRFDFQTSATQKVVYIDDYAHHPQELKAIISSVKAIYPNRKVTGIFQPHLFTRTRDFVDGFAESLSLLDELILLDIYPARELPLEGVTSDIIFRKVSIKNKSLCTKIELMNLLKTKDLDVLLTLGAGDIDTFVEPIKKMVMDKLK